MNTPAFPVAVLMVCAVASELVDIAAAGHVITHSGLVPMLLLWLWDGVVGLAVLSGLGVCISRMHSTRLLAPLCFGFGVMYLGGALAAALDPTYWQLVYWISSIEYQLLPIAAWMTIYRQAPSAEVLGRLQAATLASGGIAAALGAAVAARGALAVAVTAGALLVIALVSPAGSAGPLTPSVPVKHRPSHVFELFRLPRLRVLTLLALLHGFAYTLILGWVLTASATSTGVVGVALWYSVWRFGRIVINTLGTGWGSHHCARILGDVNLLLAVPFFHILAFLVLYWYPVAVLAIILGLGLTFIGALEPPIVKAMLTRLPEAQIDRATTLVEGFAPAVGGILATCLLLAVFAHDTANLPALMVVAALGLLTGLSYMCRPSIRDALA